jgi:hypothetical protein
MAYLHKQTCATKKVKFNRVKTKYKNSIQSSENTKGFHVKGVKKWAGKGKDQRGIENKRREKLIRGFHGVDRVDRFQGLGFGFRQQGENKLPSGRAYRLNGPVSLTAVGVMDRDVGAFWAPFAGGALIMLVGGGVVQGADGTLDWNNLFTEGGLVPEGLALVALGKFSGFCIRSETAKAVKSGKEVNLRAFKSLWAGMAIAMDELRFVDWVSGVDSQRGGCASW